MTEYETLKWTLGGGAAVLTCISGVYQLYLRSSEMKDRRHRWFLAGIGSSAAVMTLAWALFQLHVK